MGMAVSVTALDTHLDIYCIYLMNIDSSSLYVEMHICFLHTPAMVYE